MTEQNNSKNNTGKDKFDAITLSVASPEEILSWFYDNNIRYIVG